MSTPTATTTHEMPLAAGTWSVDTVHSAVEFTVRHLGLAKVRGRFNDFSGAVVVGDSVADTRVDAEVQMASVDTNNADRDAHLRSGDFFSVDTNPTMTFRSTGVVADGDDYRLDGELTLAGTTRPVSFSVELHGTEVYPMDDSTRAGFSATSAISRKDFGISFDVPLGADKVAIGDKVTIELEIQLVAPSD
ncbi:MAG: YceI family protein [Acidimicrobiales bacterium]